jgi:hypothetical protein
VLEIRDVHTIFAHVSEIFLFTIYLWEEGGAQSMHTVTHNIPPTYPPLSHSLTLSFGNFSNVLAHVFVHIATCLVHVLGVWSCRYIANDVMCVSVNAV